jgi:hypothetical protein
MLQAEFSHAPKLLVGRRRPVHFNAQNVPDLHCRRAHSSGNGVNQHTMGAARWRRLGHARLPVGQISSEVVDGESGGLLGGPVFGNWPQHIRVGADSLREGSPLDVAQDAASTALFDSGEFASGDQWRPRCSGITTLRCHEVRKVKASGSHADQRLSRLQRRFGGVLNRE